MRRLFALVFFMTLLFVFISCSEATPFKTEDAVATDLTETDNTTNTITKTEKLTKEKETSTTEFIPPQTTASTTTTTTIPPTTTTAPITTTVKPTTKAPPITTTPSAAYQNAVEQMKQNITPEMQEALAALKTCRHCGNTVDSSHHRYVSAQNCPDCGVLVEGRTCHICAN